ncbi:MAG: hypothetical protein SFT81_07010 [Candidatus Caenarcaniphilales bacterium]|nr:hypothetical protein [Candidatus Caenarcaniphilales bacterium]
MNEVKKLMEAGEYTKAYRKVLFLAQTTQDPDHIANVTEVLRPKHYLKLVQLSGEMEDYQVLIEKLEELVFKNNHFFVR